MTWSFQEKKVLLYAELHLEENFLGDLAPTVISGM
jgi:hypothetical protein